MKALQNFILGLQFLTRINLTKKSMPCEKENFQGAMNFFVIIGLIVGIGQYIIYQIFSLVSADIFAVMMSVLSGIYLTGGIHLDGLSDLFDGFGANADKERTLEIMKDSRTGTFGVVALIIDTLFHMVAFYALKDYPLLYILVPMSGKLAICYLCKIGKNIKKGLGALWIENISTWGIVLNTLIGVGISSLICQSVLRGVGLIGVIGGCIYLLNYKFKEKLGGITGDCLGATNQLAQWVVLIYFVILFT